MERTIIGFLVLLMVQMIFGVSPVLSYKGSSVGDAGLVVLAQSDHPMEDEEYVPVEEEDEDDDEPEPIVEVEEDDNEPEPIVEEDEEDSEPIE